MILEASCHLFKNSMKWPSFHLERVGRCFIGDSGCLWLSWSMGSFMMSFSAVVRPMLYIPLGHFLSFIRKNVDTGSTRWTRADAFLVLFFPCVINCMLRSCCWLDAFI